MARKMAPHHTITHKTDAATTSEEIGSLIGISQIFSMYGGQTSMTALGGGPKERQPILSLTGMHTT